MNKALFILLIMSLLILLVKYRNMYPIHIMVVILLVFTFYVVNKSKAEHFTDAESEALATLASVYNNDTMTVGNLKVTKNLTVDGKSNRIGDVLIDSTNPGFTNIGHTSHPDLAKQYHMSMQSNGDLLFNTTSGNFFFRKNDDAANNVAFITNSGIFGGTNTFYAGQFQGNNPDWAVFKHNKSSNDNYGVAHNASGSDVNLNAGNVINMFNNNGITTQFLPNKVLMNRPIVGGNLYTFFSESEGWDRLKMTTKVAKSGVLKDAPPGAGVNVTMRQPYNGGNTLHTYRMWCQKEPNVRLNTDKVACNWNGEELRDLPIGTDDANDNFWGTWVNQ